jgi:hypothetical protein
VCRPAREVLLTPGIRAVLEANVNGRTCPRGLSYRSGIVLKAADGKGNAEIARSVGVHENTVSLWRGRFADAQGSLASIEAEVRRMRAEIASELSSARGNG